MNLNLQHQTAQDETSPTMNPAHLRRPQSRRTLAAVTEPANLKAAWEKVYAKGANGGVDRISVNEFKENAEGYLQVLRAELLEDRYIPHPLLSVRIPKDSKPGEYREIGLAAVRDKIAQEAVRAVIEPRLERLFLNCSYGYRPGKGPQRAIARVNHYVMHEKRSWVAVADIDDFFGSIKQDLLLDLLRPIVEDEAIIRLTELWLKMGRVDGRGRWNDVYSGVSQGGVISPLLANLYLHSFDQAMTQRNYGLVRYADDFVLLCSDRTEAEKALIEATQVLERELHLRLNPNPRPVASLEDGFGFLGIYFRGQEKLIEQQKIEGAQRRLNQLASEVSEANLGRKIRDFNEKIAGWRRYYGTIVGKEELMKLEGIASRGLTQLLCNAYKRDALKSIAEGEASLGCVETLMERRQKERVRWIAEQVREAWRQYKEDLKARTRRQPSPHGNARPANPKQTGNGVAIENKAGLGVAAAVRKRRRDHERHMAHISELVLNTPGCFLGKTSQRVVVRGRDRKNMWEVPSFRLTGITIASKGVALSADVIDHCAEKDIPLLFLSPNGKVAAMLSAPESSSGALGLLQLQAIHQGKPAFEIAKRFVEGKIHNQMSLLKYVHKYRKQVDVEFAASFPVELKAMTDLLKELRTLQLGENYDHSRGQLFSVEGRAATRYWNLFSSLLEGKMDFPGRERKGARDLVNSLLNYGYAVLYSRVYLALIRSGLHPQLSFLHSLQKGKPTLVYDLIEEFRAPVVDRTVLTLIARREKLEVNNEGFLTEETRQRLISRIHERLSSIVRFHGKDLKLEEVILHQAHSIASHLKGEKSYRPFPAKW